MGVFIPWDIIFTINEIWGFNPDYLKGAKILSLPYEEWLFFICIPYDIIKLRFRTYNIRTRG